MSQSGTGDRFWTGWWVVAVLLSCGGCPTETPPLPDDGAVVELSTDDQLQRASMALTGLRPSPEERAAVHADPGALDDIITSYLDSGAFGETIRDMHAEVFLMRSETVVLPPIGPLGDHRQGDIYRSLVEEPLRLIEDLVMDDRPYTEVLTADYTMADHITADIWGHTHDASGPDWQRVQWMDPRPGAGVLSTGSFWLRHESDGSNYHRTRANIVASAFLCADFLTRDIPLDGSIDLSDDEAVAHAVNTQESCVACHQALDPLASTLWPVRGKITPASVARAYEDDCLSPSGQPSPSCYPVRQWDPSSSDRWERLGLRAPGFYGQPVDDIQELGQMIVDDPRFSLCTARRFYSYLSQTPLDEVPHEIAAELQDVFVESGYDAKALARAAVTSAPMRASHLTAPSDQHIAGLQVVRPEQMARLVEGLTGLQWLVNADPPVCNGPRACWGDFDLSTSGAFGFRAMAGGIDGYQITVPIHTMTPIRSLYTAAIAADAASHVVQEDFGPFANDPRLLLVAGPTDRDDATVRAQLAALHLQILGERLDPDSPEVDETLALFQGSLARNGGDTHGAWKVTISALLQDPRLLFY